MQSNAGTKAERGHRRENDFLRRQGRSKSSALGAARLAELRRGQDPVLGTGLFSLCDMKPHQTRRKNEGEKGHRQLEEGEGGA